MTSILINRSIMEHPPGSTIEITNIGSFLVLGSGLNEADKTARRILYCYSNKSIFFEQVLFVSPFLLKETMLKTDLLNMLTQAKLNQYAEIASVKLWQHYKGKKYLNFCLGVDLVSGQAAIAYHPPQDLSQLPNANFSEI